MSKDILGGGFVDFDRNTCINAILRNLNLNSTKPKSTISDSILRSGPSNLYYLT